LLGGSRHRDVLPDNWVHASVLQRIAATGGTARPCRPDLADRHAVGQPFVTDPSGSGDLIH